MKGSDNNNTTQSYYNTLKRDIESQQLTATKAIAALTEDGVLKLKMAQILIKETKAIDEEYNTSIDDILSNEDIKSKFTEVLKLQYEDIKKRLNVQEKDFGFFQSAADALKNSLSIEESGHLLPTDYSEESDVEEEQEEAQEEELDTMLQNIKELGKIHGKGTGDKVTEEAKAANKIAGFMMRNTVAGNKRNAAKYLQDAMTIDKQYKETIQEKNLEFAKELNNKGDQYIESAVTSKEGIDAINKGIEKIKAMKVTNTSKPYIPEIKEQKNEKKSTKATPHISIFKRIAEDKKAKKQDQGEIPSGGRDR